MSKRLQKIREKWTDERLSKLYDSRIPGRDGYPLTPATIFQAVVDADPTRTHKYVDWTLTAWARGAFVWEDIYLGGESRVADQLRRFETYKGRIEDPTMRSLMKYRTPSDLDAAMDKIDVPKGDDDDLILTGRQQKKEVMLAARVSSLNFDVAPDVTMEIPMSQYASQVLGRNTRWCTASRNGNMFTSYASRAPLIILNVADRRFQLFVGPYFSKKETKIEMRSENDGKLSHEEFNLILPHLNQIYSILVSNNLWKPFEGETLESVLLKSNTILKPGEDEFDFYFNLDAPVSPPSTLPRDNAIDLNGICERVEKVSRFILGKHYPWPVIIRPGNISDEMVDASIETVKHTIRCLEDDTISFKKFLRKLNRDLSAFSEITKEMNDTYHIAEKLTKVFYDIQFSHKTIKLIAKMSGRMRGGSYHRRLMSALKLYMVFLLCSDKNWPSFEKSGLSVKVAAVIKSHEAVMIMLPNFLESSKFNMGVYDLLKLNVKRKGFFDNLSDEDSISIVDYVANCSTFHKPCHELLIDIVKAMPNHLRNRSLFFIRAYNGTINNPETYRTKQREEEIRAFLDNYFKDVIKSNNPIDILSENFKYDYLPVSEAPYNSILYPEGEYWTIYLNKEFSRLHAKPSYSSEDKMTMCKIMGIFLNLSERYGLYDKHPVELHDTLKTILHLKQKCSNEVFTYNQHENPNRDIQIKCLKAMLLNMGDEHQSVTKVVDMCDEGNPWPYIKEILAQRQIVRKNIRKITPLLRTPWGIECIIPSKKDEKKLLALTRRLYGRKTASLP